MVYLPIYLTCRELFFFPFSVLCGEAVFGTCFFFERDNVLPINIGEPTIYIYAVIIRFESLYSRTTLFSCDLLLFDEFFQGIQ